MNDASLEKTKAKKTVVLLYALMAAGIALPVLLLFLKKG